MKKKIGIMTFHRADNLGAVLQAYALQDVLNENWPVEATIIDYCCSGVERSGKTAPGIKGMALKLYYAWKHLAFVRFRKRYLSLSDACNRESIQTCAARYDAVIAGSDQVWNYECSGWDDAYFLDFAGERQKKYSYAASIGNYQFSEQEKARVRQLLSTFREISVRENSAKQVLEEIGVPKTIVLPDPVFLLPADHWKKIMSRRLSKQKYVFVYLIQPDVQTMRSAEKYAREHNCKVICNKKSPEFILRSSPQDFLSWIYHAECIFTNSFHGTAFSLIFDRPVAADIQLVNGKTNFRVKELLEATGAAQCIICEGSSEGAFPRAQDVLDTFRQDAYSFLEKVCMDI